MKDATGYTDRTWANRFYGSKAWKNCRNAYVLSKMGLCESCLARGLMVPGTQVHHKTPLTPDNIGDPAVTLNWDNLELLCKPCHDAQHTKGRYIISPEGELIIK